MAKSTLKALIARAPAGLDKRDASRLKSLVKEEARRIQSILTADQMSGVGYPIDQQLRKFSESCNDDLVRGIFPPYSKIWDSISGFFNLKTTDLGSYVVLRNERNHACDADDFFAFATDERIVEQTIPKLQDLPEGVIHNYTFQGELTHLAFEEEGSPPLVISGISFVRHGDSLFWQTSGGPIVDLQAMTAERRSLLAQDEERIRRNNSDAPEEMIENILKPYAVAHPGVDNVWHCSALGVFNLREHKHEIRSLTKDWGVSQAAFSDHFEQQFAEQYQTDDAIRRMVDKAVDQIEKDHLFFEIAETAFALPAYFTARVEYISDIEHRTALGDPSEGVRRKQGLKAPLDMRIMMRNVATLSYGGTSSFNRSYSPPRFQVEVEGFWRRLSPGSVGRDAQGNSIPDRTWVTGHARWKDRPAKSGVVHVKTPVRQSIERAVALEQSKGGHHTLSVGS